MRHSSSPISKEIREGRADTSQHELLTGVVRTTPVEDPDRQSPWRHAGCAVLEAVTTGAAIFDATLLRGITVGVVVAALTCFPSPVEIRSQFRLGLRPSLPLFLSLSVPSVNHMNNRGSRSIGDQGRGRAQNPRQPLAMPSRSKHGRPLVASPPAPPGHAFAFIRADSDARGPIRSVRAVEHRV
jgi:hypothetical protein